MTTSQALAERYIATWNSTDAAELRRAVEELFAPDATYVDPMAAVQGRDAIAALIAGAQQQFAGMRFALAGPVDGHHDQLRFTWVLGPAGVTPAAAPVAGFDVAVTDEHGRVASVHGFLDRVPG